MRLFSDVWSENAALSKRLMKIHSNPPILNYGFNACYVLISLPLSLFHSRCWNSDPKIRPTMHEVVSIMSNLMQVCVHCLLFYPLVISLVFSEHAWAIEYHSGGIQGGVDFFFFFFFFFAFHPGGRSGRQTVPLPHNVNYTPKIQGGKKCV